MSQDLLERATKALREQGGAEPATDRAAFMRARLLSQAKRSSRLRPQGVWQWAAVVCLGFFVSTAMAQVIRVQLPRVIEALRREPAAEELKAKKAAKPAQPKAATPVEPAKLSEPEPAAPSGVEPAAPSGVEPAAPSGVAEPAAASGAKPAPTTPAARSSRSVTRAPAKRYIPAQPIVAPAPAAEPEEVALEAAPPKAAPAVEATPATSKPKGPPEPAELALFRRAQSLHLAHDPRAIAAWDAFLRAAPSSALAPEARYNRALGLVRAHQYADARRALQTFAAGAYGSYRKQEAQQLLDRLPE